ncbi:LOW QUALITY PROTEIN: integral membrane protein GPR155-like [Pecten maximus]|uniref:LOW QUALITY PROTEIN: integral membrane protein GPR155-like n=1 Tax=Pecten maximus TaxID=6579 RepID=UPI0014585643|nr:LOW QUALITY PROTEIN: integral membrane protein GPR155-like [Pecten maximus]
MEVDSNSTTPSSVPTDMGNVSIDNLYPAIIQCFFIILVGYIAGRVSLISASQSRGIGLFVSNFCLPALLFKNMCILDFSVVNWLFLTSILISKSLVFFLVVFVTLVAKRPLNYGYAGMFGIFATQSNDFALGYPIIQALYEKSHPEYLKYIYLIAPISVVFLNPIGFVLLEIQKRRTQVSKDSLGSYSSHGQESESLLGNSGSLQKKPETTTHTSTAMVAAHVFKGVISNPIVFMTVIGIIGNFIFKHNLPAVLEGILTSLGNAFSAAALFYLGLSLVGKVSGTIGIGLLLPLLLIAAKALVLPLVIWQIVGAMERTSGGKDVNLNSTISLSMYGFLYGTFPTAPSVFLYASQYSLAQDTVATGMVAGTFFSAPMMFMSAKMLTVVVNSEMDYKTLLLETSFDTSIISVVCCIWVLGILMFSKRYKKMPHQFLVCLVFSHMLSCIGMIIYNGHDSGQLSWKHYLQFALILIGVFATRCWTAVISVTLYMLHCRSLCSVLRFKGLMYLFAFGLPVFCTGLLFILGSHHVNNEIDPSFHYGPDQSAIKFMSILSVIVLVLCSAINIVCLILKQRNSRERNESYQTLNSDSTGDSTNLHRQKKRRKIYKPPQRAKSRSNNSDHAMLEDLHQQVFRLTMEAYPGSQFNSSGSFTASGSMSLNAECERQQAENKQNCDTCSGGCYQDKDFEDIVPFPSERDNLLSSENSSVSEASSVQENLEDKVCKYGTCSQDQRRSCTRLVRSYHADTALIQSEESGVTITSKSPSKSKNDFQSGKFMILLICNQVSMIVGVFLCIWRLMKNDKSGIYVEIEFLDGVFNYGQGFLLLAIFGFDTKFIFLPCIRNFFLNSNIKWLNILCLRWRRMIYGIEIVEIPDRDDLDEETRHLCDQFLRYHKDNCIKDIVTDKVYRLQEYKAVFTGQDMCNWLLEVGLARDRSEAVTYAQSLLIGQVLQHVSKEHHFHDMPYFYRFLEIDLDEFP